ncbi:hypothetical protein HHK36_029660 [Tetracentron sinense]|uniref:Trichome birefringence-like N-terminal domain-containing protein n=1 Tax=Tetracentron sinense TaxID=13715 RepID=A0A834Y9Z6_TETSI|nr:hypothetical protein HHK36_029660 [Tetracentron sinense]
MGTIHPLKDQPHSLTTKLLPWSLYALLSLALLRLYFYPLPLTQSLLHQVPQNKPIIITSSSSQEDDRFNRIPCDYTTNGKWVRDKSGPLYNGTSCGTIKEGQNCISHGRPDMGYLYWRWKPKQCKLPRFEPATFLRLFQNKHLAFVGDSMARNQLESLLCLLATVSPPDLIYQNGDDNKFRRWYFPSYNIHISIYWSPFLVKGIEKSNTGLNYNRLYLDLVDEKWASDMGEMDMIVLSVGHWFLHPAVYFEEDSVLGCHYCPGLNHTEIGFYDIFRKAFKTTLKAIVEKKHGSSEIDVIVTTFSPSHFQGDWDKAGACPKKKPFMEGEKLLEGMDLEMRNIEVEEVEAAKIKATQFSTGLRLEVLDVTKLSSMRPDGHPGPYMYPFPFANGVTERVPNDCVHWCLPGPIDTWNEIMLEVVKRWHAQSRRGG